MSFGNYKYKNHGNCFYLLAVVHILKHKSVSRLLLFHLNVIDSTQSEHTSSVT